jgi:hypothetical protein
MLNKEQGQTLPLLFSYCTNAESWDSWVNIVKGLGLDERTAVFDEELCVWGGGGEALLVLCIVTFRKL